MVVDVVDVVDEERRRRKERRKEEERKRGVGGGGKRGAKLAKRDARRGSGATHTVSHTYITHTYIHSQHTHAPTLVMCYIHSLIKLRSGF